MASHQVLHRKKLRPKKPSGISRKKGKTTIIHNPGNVDLTKSQKSWARSLTGSLSGWASRRRFYKDHLEARVQAEAEAEALSQAAKVEREAQRSANEAASHAQAIEDEAKIQALAQQKYVEEAAAWRHKARLMHEAGKGEKEITGWDPAEEHYIRDWELEAQIARIKAERKAAMDGSDTDSDRDSRSRGSSEDDRSSIDSDTSDLEIVVPEASSEPKSRLSPISKASPAPILDWREKARIGVAKKKLFINKGWGAVTWNQKSNVQERLLLLEEDGYDVQAMQDRKVSSEEVTAIILKRAAAMQGFQTTENLSTRSGEASAKPSAEALDASPAWLDPSLSQANPPPTPHFSSPPRNQPPKSQHKTVSPARPSHLPKQRPKPTPLEDTTQPFHPSDPYHPQPSNSLKRKHTSSPDDALTTSHVRKKRNITHYTESELAAAALQDVKTRVLRSVYRSSRSILRNIAPVARVVFRSASPTKTEENSRVMYENETSTLEYLYTSQSSSSTNSTALTISTRGFKELIAELRWLSSSSSSSSSPSTFSPSSSHAPHRGTVNNEIHNDTNMLLYDPDFETPILPLPPLHPTTPAERIKHNILTQQRQRTRIAISTSSSEDVVVQGAAHILAALFKTLREGRLAHRVGWDWDGERLRDGGGLDWYLGPGTVGVLGCLEGRLRGVQRGEGNEVIVDVGGGEDG